MQKDKSYKKADYPNKMLIYAKRKHFDDDYYKLKAIINDGFKLHDFYCFSEKTENQIKEIIKKLNYNKFFSFVYLKHTESGYYNIYVKRGEF